MTDTVCGGLQSAEAYNPLSPNVLANVRRVLRETPEIGLEHFDKAYDAAILMLVREAGLDLMLEALTSVVGASRRRAALIAESIWRCAELSRQVAAGCS